MKPHSFDAILFYDGHCSICKKVKSIIELFDIKKKVRLFDLWGASSSDEFQHINFQELVKEIHLIDNQGKIYTGYFAFRQIAKKIWLFYPLFLLSFLPGIDYIGNMVYKFVSENRYRFGCETCGKLYCKIHLSHHN